MASLFGWPFFFSYELRTKGYGLRTNRNCESQTNCGLGH